jgi:methyl-accepting chemotaxis protein
MKIKSKFFLAVTVFFVVLTILGVWADSASIRNIVFDEYREKAELALYAMKAVRAHVRQVVRPYADQLVGQDDFIPELQSTSFTANGVFSKIDPEHKGELNFKTASIKPRNPKNAATPEEADIIERISARHMEGEPAVWEGVHRMNGERTYIMAIGEITRESCLRCHGRPEDAPASLRARYPVDQDRSYDQQPGRIYSAEMVTIPLTSIRAEARRFIEWIVLGAAALLVVVLVAISMGLNYIFRPITVLTEVAQLIASGELSRAAESVKSLKRSSRALKKDRKDEVDLLAGAFEQMTENLNHLIGGVQEAGADVTSTSAEIAASARQLEATVAEQAASANEVAATSRSISDRARNLTETVTRVSEIAGSTSELAEEGRTGLDGMEEAMRHLMDSSASISEKLSAINDKAGDIDYIVTTITKVAEQTNLLSLNASIEAEKAGEAGLGFSVVAREIRRLADQTAVSATNIGRTIKEMQSAVSTGVMEMDKFVQKVRVSVQDVERISQGQTIIIEQVRELSPQFLEVREAVEAQTGSAEEISEAMNQLRDSVEQSKESLMEFNKAAQLLNDAAQGLQDEVMHFRVERKK